MCIRDRQHQHGQHGVVLHRLLAEQAVCDAGIGVEAGALRGHFGRHQPAAAGDGQHDAGQWPGPSRQQAVQHARILALDWPWFLSVSYTHLIAA